MRDSISSILKLSIPIIVGQLGQMLIIAGDVYIATMFSTKAVASIGVASGFINPVFLFGIGLMMGVSAVLALRRGEGEDDTNNLSSIILYAAVVGVALTLIMLVLNKFIPYMGMDEELLPSMQKYISIVAWSFPFAIIFQGIKEYLQSYEKVLLPNLMAIIAVFLNLGLNYILVFGIGDIGGLGEVGLAYASVGIRVVLCLSIFIYVLMSTSLKPISLKLIDKIFKFSLPIACMFFFEVLAFCVVAILSGGLGIIAAATNNIIMTIASISFMIPLSISSAIAVKIGHGFGLKNPVMLRNYIKASVSIILVYIIFSSGAFLLFPEFIMGAMTDDIDVVGLGIKLLFIVGMFQFADGLQVVLSGILRGLNETKISFCLVLLGYWVIGIPIGSYLTFEMNCGVEGLWTGLAISLFIVATTLSILTYHRYKALGVAKS